METDKKKAKHVTGIDFYFWKAVKNAAMDRGITDNEMYLRLLKSGAKRHRIVVGKA